MEISEVELEKAFKIVSLVMAEFYNETLPVKYWIRI